MSVSAVRSVLVEGPQAPRARGPYTYASTPRALYNNAKLRRDPSCATMCAWDGARDGHVPRRSDDRWPANGDRRSAATAAVSAGRGGEHPPPPLAAQPSQRHV
ncbi:hypothetical protein K1T71_004782 [Dendrolimus kikuchii]|uniref:Uncharacterized protein n=1 Tax=Dendrolimus kikuchii TaxID=765133 RepID=A0ACC1D8F6_9NEOP|nr:hypothetical protein K1T71_004782 [Dendrolimus kikuchii]